jgi:hypothetical protein
MRNAKFFKNCLKECFFFVQNCFLLDLSQFCLIIVWWIVINILFLGWTKNCNLRSKSKRKKFKQGSLTEGKAQYGWPHNQACFVIKENNSLKINSSCSKLVITRRSTVLSLPFQLGFPVSTNGGHKKWNKILIHFLSEYFPPKYFPPKYFLPKYFLPKYFPPKYFLPK